MPEGLAMVFLLDSKGAEVCKSLDSKSAKVCESRRSQEILQNEPIGFDTAEKGTSNVWAANKSRHHPGQTNIYGDRIEFRSCEGSCSKIMSGTKFLGSATGTWGICNNEYL